MTQDEMKKAAAQAAIDYIEFDDVIGVGTGSTVNFFITALEKVKGKIDAAVASSLATEQLLKQIGIRVLDLNQAGELRLYVDGADEVTPQGFMIKGGGGALTREKIVAEASEKFICIIDESKYVKVLGEFPLPIEVIPMAQSMVARRIVKLGGLPELRAEFVTDNENIIIDVKNMDLINPIEMEKKLNNIPGVVTNGLFALNAASTILNASINGVMKISI